jgi:hypothetical protein
MNSTGVGERTRRGDWFVRTAGVIGDFGSPIYTEERQRDVWNEASAFGFQLLLWVIMLAGTVAVWTVGAPAVPYGLAFLGLAGLVSTAVVVYAKRLGVDPNASYRFRSPSAIGAIVLLLAFYGGLIHALWVARPFGDAAASGWWGLVVGFGVGGAAGVGAAVLRVRRAKQAGSSTAADED